MESRDQEIFRVYFYAISVLRLSGFIQITVNS